MFPPWSPRPASRARPPPTSRPLSPASDRHLMEHALADYLRPLGLERNSSAHTVKSYREDLTQALSFFRDKLGATSQVPPDRITTRLVRSYLAWLSEQGYAKTTVARRLAAVR